MNNLQKQKKADQTGLQHQISEWPSGLEITLSPKQALLHQSSNIQVLSKVDLVRLKGDIAYLCYTFLKVNSTGENNDLVSQQFSESIIRTRPDWKLPEIKTFFNTIVDRQDLEGFNIVGYKITPLKLSEMVAFYEDNFRSEEREKILAEQKNAEISEPFKLANSDVVKKSLSKIYELTKKDKGVLVNHLNQSKEEIELQEDISNIDTESVNKKIQGWMKEFDELYDGNIDTESNERIVFIKNIGYTSTQFLELKMSEI